MHLVADTEAWRGIDNSGDAERALRAGQHGASGDRAGFGKIEGEAVFDLCCTDSKVLGTVHGRRSRRKAGGLCRRQQRDRHEVGRRRADKGGDEGRCWVLHQLFGRAKLLDLAVIDHGDMGRHGHGFHLVVGYIDRGGAGCPMDAQQFGAHLDTQFGIEIGKRLVKEERAGARGDHARNGNALLLSARDLVGIARGESFDAQQAQDLAHPCLPRGLIEASHFQGPIDIARDGHVRPKRIGLEHEAGIALGRIDHPAAIAVGHHIVAELYGATAWQLKPGEHAQHGGFAAA